MVECNSHGTHNIYPKLNDQQQFRLNKISDIKDYFELERQGSSYIVSFDYFDKTLIFLSVTTGSFLLHHLQLLLEHW